MNWGSIIANLIVAFLKGIFGRGGQEEYSVDSPKEYVPPTPDAELLSDLGVHPGSADKD